MTALRITPLFGFGSRRALRIIERNLLVYKHGWLVLLSGFFEPLFYLLSIGFGLGVLVGDVAGPGGQPIPYALFVAPALLGASAMNGAITESTFNFFFKLNYDKTFASILTTPMSPADVSLGELALGAHPRRAVHDRLPGRDGRVRAWRARRSSCSRSRARS